MECIHIMHTKYKHTLHKLKRNQCFVPADTVTKKVKTMMKCALGKVSTHLFSSNEYQEKITLYTACSLCCFLNKYMNIFSISDVLKYTIFYYSSLHAIKMT